MINKIFKAIFVVVVAGFLVLILVRMVHFHNLEKTNEQVAIIHATKLTLADVMGENLPPDPGEAADDTIAGIDANQNGIRDDVELAIFKEYPNSAKKRSPLLQYALVLQMQMTLPLVNKETVTETVAYSDSRANKCMWTLSSRSDLDKFSADMEKFRNYVESLQLNTQARYKYRYDLIEYNLDSYSMSNEGCDINPATLPN